VNMIPRTFVATRARPVVIGQLMIGVTFAIAVAGCSSLWQIKPSPVTPVEASSSGGAAQPAIVATAPKDESEVRCEQLARATPGLEEIRMGNDGAIESRQWTLIAHDSATPRWAVVRAKDQTPGGWAPRPGIGKLNFNPPLQPLLPTGRSRFLAYAPVDVKNYDDLQTTATLNEVFGAPQGKFQWRGKSYGYALTTRLPCYPPLLQ
jgi:hypothetical protein